MDMMATVKGKQPADDFRIVLKEGEIKASKSCNRKIKEWQDVEVHIGITGRSGTGKSSFINAIRGVADDHDTAAIVGVTETTTKPSRYTMNHGNRKIHLWDLPGIGTPNFPNDEEKYCRRVRLKSYDSILILSSGRFTENDRRLANMIRMFGESIFFVRTSIDVNIRAEKRKRSFNEESTLRVIREDCVKNLSGIIPQENVFLIRNHHTTRWDFNRLTQAIFDVQFKKQCNDLLQRFNSVSVT